MLFLAALREQEQREQREQREQEPKVVEIDQFKNEWVSVKERLPESETEVLVWELTGTTPKRELRLSVILLGAVLNHLGSAIFAQQSRIVTGMSRKEG